MKALALNDDDDDDGAVITTHITQNQFLVSHGLIKLLLTKITKKKDKKYLQK